jgi:hypothetical protein
LRTERDLLEIDVITHLINTRFALEKNQIPEKSLSKICNYLFSRGFNETKILDKINEKMDLLI